MTTINTQSLAQDIITFSKRNWVSDNNKHLLRLVGEQRLNLAPCTVFTLDKQGFNHLEILSFSHMVGKVVHRLTTCECEQLNEWEQQKGIVFGYEQKESGKYIKAKVDHFYYAFEEGKPMGVSALFSLDLYKNKQ